jgi:prophage endopeptidase
MTVRQRDVAALDAKYTGELAHAQATIDQLERDVAAGKRRLRVAATCPAYGATSAGGVGDATSPDLQTPLNGIISPSESESPPSPGK